MKLPDELQILWGRLRAEGTRLREQMAGGDSKALTQLLTPNLGGTPAPLKRWLEPVVAAAALAVLASLLGIAVFNFATLVLIASLVWGILTYVFGLELDLSV